MAHEQLSMLEPRAPKSLFDDSHVPTFPSAIPGGEPTVLTPGQEHVTEGVSMSLKDYYLGLHGLLKLAKSLNTNSNFLTQTDQQGSPSYLAVQRHMRLSDTQMEERIGQAKASRVDMEATAKRQFAGQVFGKRAIVDAGLVTEDEAKTLAREEYKDLTDQFFDPSHKDALSKKSKKVERRLASLGVTVPKRRR